MTCNAFSHIWRYDHKYARTCTTCGKHQIHWNCGSLPDRLSGWIPAPIIIAILLITIFFKRWFTTDCQEYQEKLADLKTRDEQVAANRQKQAVIQAVIAQQQEKAKRECKYANHKNGV